MGRKLILVFAVFVCSTCFVNADPPSPRPHYVHRRTWFGLDLGLSADPLPMPANPVNADQVLTNVWNTANAAGQNALAIVVGSGSGGGTTNPTNANQVLTQVWNSANNALAVYCVTGCSSSGTVASVGLTVNGTSPSGIFTVTGSPVTTSGSLNVNLTGTSGGIPYFSSASVMSSSTLLTANLPVIGGGAGTAPGVGTVTGNTTQFATWTGATTASRCVHTDASGNLLVAAADCGSGSGSVTSVGLTVNGTSPSGIFTVTGSPVTTTGTLNFNLALTSGGIPYASSSTVLSSSGLLTQNVLVKGGGAGAAPLPSQVTDDGTNPIQSPDGFTSITGPYADQLTNASPATTTLNHTVCYNASQQGIICPTTATVGIAGTAVQGAGVNGGPLQVCWKRCLPTFDNQTTAGDIAIPSTTVAGDLHDTGGTVDVVGVQNMFVRAANSGAGTTALTDFLSPDQVAGAGGKSTVIQVNGTTTKGVANFNGTTPAAPTNGINLTWATSNSGNTTSASAAVVGDGNSGHFLNGTGAFSAPSSSGVTSVGLALPTSTFTITNSPVTTTGTLTGTFTTQGAGTFFGVPPAAAGGATFIQACTGGTYASGTSQGCSSSISIAAGDTVIIAGQNNANLPQSASDPAVNDTFTQRRTTSSTTSASVNDTLSSAGGTATPTMTFTAGPGRNIVALEYNGITAFDVVSSAASEPNPVTVSVTTTAANDLLITCISSQVLTSDTPGAISITSAGWTERGRNDVSSGSIHYVTICADKAAGAAGVYSVTAQPEGSNYNLNVILAAYKTGTTANAQVPSFFGPLTMASMPSGVNRVLYSTAPAAGTSSLSATTMTASSGQQAFEFKSYLTQTVVGSSCAGNTTVVVNIIYQDPNAASAQTVALGTYTVTTNGTIGVVPWTSGPTSWTFEAKSGSLIQFSTTYTAGGSCSPAPTVQFFPILLGLSGQ